jgi:hypothetical protein
MKAKRPILTIVAFIALAGILSCALIEPAFAYKEESATPQNDEAHCCFICHSMHHLWIKSEATISLDGNAPIGRFLPSNPFAHHDPATGSIFHPPLAR